MKHTFHLPWQASILQGLEKSYRILFRLSLSQGRDPVFWISWMTGGGLSRLVLKFLSTSRMKLIYWIQLQNVFLTGQPSVLPGFSERLHAVLQSLLPPGSSINIRRAADPGLDSWKGMAAFSRTEEFRRGQCAVTKAVYDEYGGERVKRWWGGNWNGEFDIGVPVDDNEDTKMDVDS